MNQLATLSRFVVGSARMFCGPMSDQQLRTRLQPGHHHAAWVLGHIAVAADAAIKYLGGQPLCPDTWNTFYGQGSSPDAEHGILPTRDELLGAIERGHARALELAAQAERGTLDRPHGIEMLTRNTPIQTVGDLLWLLLVADPQFHLGQVSVYRRAQGFAPMF